MTYNTNFTTSSKSLVLLVKVVKNYTATNPPEFKFLASVFIRVAATRAKATVPG